MKKILLLISFTFLLFLIFGCSNADQNEITDDLDYSNPKMGDIESSFSDGGDPLYSKNNAEYNKGELAYFIGVLTGVLKDSSNTMLIFGNSNLICYMDSEVYNQSQVYKNMKIKVLGFIDFNVTSVDSVSGDEHSVFNNCIIEEVYEDSVYEFDLINDTQLRLDYPYNVYTHDLLDTYNMEVVTITGIWGSDAMALLRNRFVDSYDYLSKRETVNTDSLAAEDEVSVKAVLYVTSSDKFVWKLYVFEITKVS